MTIPMISPADIRRQSNAKSFERGEQYYRSGAVISVSQRDQLLQAMVEGSAVLPYRVTAQVDVGGMTSLNCTCPYGFDGWCKHIVAVMLTCAHEPELVEVLPSLPELLAPLSPVQLRQVIDDLVQNRPELIEQVDRQINLMTGSAPITLPEQRQRKTKIDPAPFRYQVLSILQDGVDAWESGDDNDPVTYELLDLIRQAQAFSQQGDGDSAIVILAAITQGCVEDWHIVADYGLDSGEVVKHLDQAWAEAILTATLTGEQRETLRAELLGWQDLLDGTFVMGLMALQQGWDDPMLLAVFQDQITEQGIWPDAVPAFADKLARIRLQILERENRLEDYLRLAEAEGQTEQYVTMLARLGQIEAAVTIAKTDMTLMAEAFAFAKILREQGAVELALEIAQLGLSLPSHTAGEMGYGNRPYELADWMSNLAQGLGDQAVALTARVAAFKATPSFGDYQKIEELAGQDWPPLRKELLQTLRNRQALGCEAAKVDIFLHEKLIDSAITAVKDLSYYRAPLVHRVMAVAIAERPDWVIENAKRRAEEIMHRGRSKAYYYAIEWLRQVREAYIASGRDDEWKKYRAQLNQQHGRKYGLMSMLNHRDLD
jgi:uncharacterized Zn finger protein